MTKKNKVSETELIEISSIKRGPETRIRVDLNEDVIGRFTELMKDDKTFYGFPPVDIYRTPDCDILSDGHLRTESAERAGRKQIVAQVFQGTLDDALWNAIVANQKNSNALSERDIRHAIEIAVIRWPERSTTDIASAIGCSQPTVSRVKQRLIQENKINAPGTTVGIDGVERRLPIRKVEIKSNEAVNSVNPIGDSEYIETCDVAGNEGRELKFNPLAPAKPNTGPYRNSRVSREMEVDALLKTCKELAAKLDESLTEAYERARQYQLMDKYEEVYEEIVEKLDFTSSFSAVG